jgi:integrase
MLRIVDRNGRRRWTGLGKYPDVGLADARKKAIDARRAFAEGNDPSQRAKAAARAAEAAQRMTLGEAIRRYLADAAPAFKNAKSEAIRTRCLNVHFAPLHAKDVASITPSDVAAILRPLALGTAIKAHTVARAVFDFAATILEPHGVTLRNPADPRLLRHLGWRPAMKSENLPALDWRRILEFMNMLAQLDEPEARCLEFTILTVVRLGATRVAKWRDVDLENRVWRVPIIDLKDWKYRRGLFVAPLSPATVELIEQLPRTDQFLFGQISDRAIINLLRRIHRRGDWKDPVSGKPIVAHGFRATFRTWTQDNRMSREIAELSLGHAFHGAVERAYARGEFLEERRQMLEAWSRHCRGETAAVIPFRRA